MKEAVLVLDLLNADQQAATGSTVELKCPFTAKPSNNLMWTYIIGSQTARFTENSLINNITLSPTVYRRLSVSGNHGNGEYHLKIANIRKSDEGIYECSVSMNILRITLTVIGRSIISS